MSEQKIYKRKIYQQLVNWKERSKGSSALLIEGARRVGKTYIAEEFGKNEFLAFKTIDFSIASPLLLDIFNDLSDVDKFFERLFLSLNMGHLPKGSLIIFDEVQFCPKARQAIKRLVQDGRYYYIETGSLVSIKENIEDILIPSDEENINMYPMDYEEFLWALGLEYEANTIKEHYLKKEPFDNKIHAKLMENYRIYLAVGGMPKVVDTYVSTKDFFLVENEKHKILKLYEEDLLKIDNRFNTVCSLVWKQIPIMLSHHSKRFIVKSIGKKERADSVSFVNTMEKLIESRIVNVVYKCNDPSGGYVLTKDYSAFKIYFSDVGLFTSIVYANRADDSDNIYQKLVFNKLHLNLGMLYENAVAQGLDALNFEPYYYSWINGVNGNKRFYEIDFIINRGGKTIPFEVKSGNVYSLSSFEAFKKKFSKNIGAPIVVYPKQFKIENNVTYLPFYMMFALK